ncbi:GDSL-type esterase/lipase family protein [Kordiimonas aestuarii]|uniref:GDSL-type esterase/lipase family protein n=1 Tax=Kordiimonas aestuarii TaxID=1005925 RepID=UPI0021D3151E|nr:GDSL-type esterase/lipase family protein [Kordiimonas aestuarii]
MRIGFFGDSFIAGMGEPDGKGWVGRVAERSGFTAVNFGIGGDTSTDVLRRWRAEAEGANLDRLVFSFGANDCLLTDHKRITVGQVDRLKNAKSIMAEAGKKWPVLFVSPLPVAGDRAATNRIGEMARQLITFTRIHRTPYVNIFDDVNAADVWHGEALANDGAHPGAAGYGFVADLVAAHPEWQAWLKS